MITISIYILLCLVILTAVIFDSFATATITMIIAGTVYHFTQQNVWHLLRDNYILVLKFVPLYILIGVVWSFVKWILFALGFKRFREENKNNTKRINLLNQRETLYYYGTAINNKLSASYYKSKIIAWMCWWPFSIVATIIDDPIKKFFIFLYETLSGSYQKISDKIAPEMKD